MKRRPALAAAAAAVAAAAALAGGCPLPQPLAEVARVDGGTIAPPRLVTDTGDPSDTVILVKHTCPSLVFTLRIQVEDVNTTERVDARWFVDYDPNVFQVPFEAQVLPSDDPANVTRIVPPYAFDLSKTLDAPVHVVELRVSNGFQPISTTNPAQNRIAQPGFETDLYRWVFEFDDVNGRCP